MLDFLKQNAGTIIVGAIVLSVVILVIIKMRKDKKNNKSGCGCGCSGCPDSNSCNKHQ